MHSVPSDPYELVHWHLNIAHDVHRTGLYTILSHLDNPPRDDLRNFLGYCEAWARSLEHQLDTQESIVFPTLGKKIDLSHEREQHETVQDFLSTFLDAVLAARGDAAAFDARQLKALLLAAEALLIMHFDEVLACVAAPTLKDAGFTGVECRDVVAAMERYAKAHGNPFLVVPYVRTHTPPEYKDVWPSMPWVLRKFVIPCMLAKKHSGYWKYAPYPVS